MQRVSTPQNTCRETKLEAADKLRILQSSVELSLQFDQKLERGEEGEDDYMMLFFVILSTYFIPCPSSYCK